MPRHPFQISSSSAPTHTYSGCIYMLHIGHVGPPLSFSHSSHIYMWWSTHVDGSMEMERRDQPPKWCFFSPLALLLLVVLVEGVRACRRDLLRLMAVRVLRVLRLVLLLLKLSTSRDDHHIISWFDWFMYNRTLIYIELLLRSWLQNNLFCSHFELR